MAILKHLSSKSSNYGNALQYLMFEYDKLTNKPLRDFDNNLIMRQKFHLDGINCDPATFAMECDELNKQYRKNNTYDEIKSHHYILSFDPKDAAKGKLTGEKAQAIAWILQKRTFPAIRQSSAPTLTAITIPAISMSTSSSTSSANSM